MHTCNTQIAKYLNGKFQEYKTAAVTKANSIFVLQVRFSVVGCCHVMAVIKCVATCYRLFFKLQCRFRFCSFSRKVMLEKNICNILCWRHFVLMSLQCEITNVKNSVLHPYYNWVIWYIYIAFIFISASCNFTQSYFKSRCKSQNMPPVERCRWHLSTSQKMPPQVLPRQQMPKAIFSQPYLTKNVYEKD